MNKELPARKPLGILAIALLAVPLGAAEAFLLCYAETGWLLLPVVLFFELQLLHARPLANVLYPAVLLLAVFPLAGLGAVPVLAPLFGNAAGQTVVLYLIASPGLIYLAFLGAVLCARLAESPRHNPPSFP